MVIVGLLAAPLLFVPALVGSAIDGWMGTAPLGLALGVGAGALLASAAVTRVVLLRFEQLAPGGREEERIE